MNRRQLLAQASAGLGILVLGGCASGGRSRGYRADLPGEEYPPSPRPRVANRQSGKPAWYDDEIGRTGPVSAEVLPRSVWTSEPPIMSRADPMRVVSRITVHHDGMSPFYSTVQSEAARRLEAIRRAHIGQGWADIGYHFAIDPAGRVYACRPVAIQGAHVKDQNPGNLGVMVMGNFEQQAPTAAATATLESFVAAMMRQFRVGVRSVHTHRELSATACPGRSLQQRMVQARAAGGPLAFA